VDFIILAAGTSSRLPAANKLLLPFEDEPLCLHSIRQALEASSTLGGKVTIVTGHQSGKVRRLLTSYSLEHRENLRFAYNQNYISGQFSSTNVGLKAIQPDSPFFICVGDLPLITADHYLKLAPLLKGHDAVRPFYGTRPGHPVLLASRLRQSLISMPDSQSVRGLLDDCDVLELHTDDPAWTTDIDTWEQYEKISDTVQPANS